MKTRQIELETVVSVPFEENAFIVYLSQNDKAVVVDPGFGADKIATKLDRHGLRPVAMLLTHAHGDHIGGIGALRDRWPDCPVVIGMREAPNLLDPEANLSAMFGFELQGPPADITVDHGQTYTAAGIDFEVREIPGHTVGHVVYVVKSREPYWVFVGDVIFSGSVGRTDFPGGSFQKLAEGIHKELFTLPDDTRLFPGHGPATTVGQEKRTNPYVGLKP